MMRGHPDLAALLAVRLVVAVIDQKNGVIVGERLRRDETDRGAAVCVRGEAVVFPCAV